MKQEDQQDTTNADDDNDDNDDANDQPPQRGRSLTPERRDTANVQQLQRARSQVPRQQGALHGPPMRRARSQTPRPKPELTVPVPFKFETDIRGERYREQFQQRLEKWKVMEKENHFKALPVPVYPEQKVPKKSTKPLTHPETIHLRTDDRAQRREEIEQERRVKLQLIQEMRAEKAREDEVIRVSLSRKPQRWHV